MSHTSKHGEPAAGLRDLPSVDHVLKQPAVATLLEEYPRGELLNAIREVLDGRRAAIRAGRGADLDFPALALDVRQRLHERARPSLRRVINATGIVLHTGLGRAPLAPEAIAAIVELAGGYCNLELDLQSGQRGDRHEHLRPLLRELTGAEDALVVNNNAAATYLALNTLAAGRGVIVSRGELVEIGGSYRMPEIMAAAGCRMIEVGTTNRTRIADYERGLDAEAAVLLRVHASNYRIRGFVESASLAELVDLARRRRTMHRLVVIDDLGSGLLSTDFSWPGASGGAGDDAGGQESGPASGGSHRPPPPSSWGEPTVRESVAAGADVTLFSGDKLLGGPQAGVIVGRADLVEQMQRNPLMRTFRPDKMTLAALEATLRLYRDPESLTRNLPVLRMLALGTEEAERRARALVRELLAALPEAQVTCAADVSFAGGGSLPELPFPTWVVRVYLPRQRSSELAAALRTRAVPVLCRLHADGLILDCRTLADEEATQIASALAEVAREGR